MSTDDDSHSDGESSESSKKGGARASRPSVIPSTQPIALSPTMPNQSLANLERRTANARGMDMPPSIPPERDGEESAVSSMTFTTDFSDADTAERHGPNVAAIILVIVLVVMAGFGVYVATGLSGGGTPFHIGGGSNEVWPSDLPNAENPRTPSETATPAEEEPAPAETATPTPTPTNTVAYTASWNYVGKKTGTDGSVGYLYTITLQQAQPVSRVQVGCACSGGAIYVYADSTASNPQNGSPVGAAAFDASGTTNINLNSTTTTQNLTLWVPQAELPTSGRLSLSGGVSVY